MDAVLLGTALLLAVSLLVRVLPGIVPLPIPRDKQYIIDEVLPMVVLVHVGVYAFADEVLQRPLPALAGMAGLFAAYLLLKLQMINAVIVATALFLAVRAF